MLSSSFGFATCVIMDVLSMETRCFAPFGYTVLFLGKHYQAHYSPLAVHALQKRPLLTSHVNSMHAVPFTRPMSERGERPNMWGDSPDVHKQSVSSPALEMCVSAGAGSILPPAAAAATVAPTHTHTLTHTHNINCVIRLQCLPRDGDRAPAASQLSTTTRLQSAHLSVCWCSCSL